MRSRSSARSLPESRITGFIADNEGYPMARARYRDGAEGAFRTRAASHDRGLPRRRDRDCGGISGVTGSGPSRDALRPRPRPICFARPDRRSEPNGILAHPKLSMRRG